MSEIKALLASLDEMRGNATQGEWEQVSTLSVFVGGEPYGNDSNEKLIIALHNAYPTLRTHIEKLEREAEAGRVLAEEVAGIGRCKHLEDSEKYEIDVPDCDCWCDNRDTALSAYHTATQDLTSSETVKCSIKVEDFASLLQPGRIEAVEPTFTLADVLRAIEAVGDEHLYADSLMRLLNVQCGGAAHFTGASSEELWDLAKTYEDQSAECKAFLEGILCK